MLVPLHFGFGLPCLVSLIVLGVACQRYARGRHSLPFRPRSTGHPCGLKGGGGDDHDGSNKVKIYGEAYFTGVRCERTWMKQSRKGADPP